jgi:hypothetical protein
VNAAASNRAIPSDSKASTARFSSAAKPCANTASARRSAPSTQRWLAKAQRWDAECDTPEFVRGRMDRSAGSADPAAVMVVGQPIN